MLRSRHHHEVRVTAVIDPTTELRFVDGQSATIAELAGAAPLVVFCFPAAFSPGCVAQACAFRNLAAEFATVSARCVGVSADTPRRLRAFSRTFRLGLPLVSDRDGALGEALGAKRGFPSRLHRRVTVVIDGSGLVLARFEGLRDLAGHADAALSWLAQNRPPERPRG